MQLAMDSYVAGFGTRSVHALPTDKHSARRSGHHACCRV